MMGDRKIDQGALFYAFSLERHLRMPKMLRSIAGSLTWTGSGRTWRRSTAPSPLADEGGTLRYGASKFGCDACDLKPKCSPNARMPDDARDRPQN